MRLFNLDIHVKYKLVNFIYFLSYLKSVVTPT